MRIAACVIAVLFAGVVFAIDEKPDERPVAELLLLTRVLASSRVDAKRGLLPLEPERLGAAQVARQG